jgi:hypothetical protein
LRFAYRLSIGFQCTAAKPSVPHCHRDPDTWPRGFDHFTPVRAWRGWGPPRISRKKTPGGCFSCVSAEHQYCARTHFENFAQPRVSSRLIRRRVLGAFRMRARIEIRPAQIQIEIEFGLIQLGVAVIHSLGLGFARRRGAPLTLVDGMRQAGWVIKIANVARLLRASPSPRATCVREVGVELRPYLACASHTVRGPHLHGNDLLWGACNALRAASAFADTFRPYTPLLKIF